eukprot:2089403-Rhodomonas_salina.2
MHPPLLVQTAAEPGTNGTESARFGIQMAIWIRKWCYLDTSADPVQSVLPARSWPCALTDPASAVVKHRPPEPRIPTHHCRIATTFDASLIRAV